MAPEAVFTRDGRTVTQGMLAAPVALAGEAHGRAPLSVPGAAASARPFARCGSRCLFSGLRRIAHGSHLRRTAALPPSGPCGTSRTLGWPSTHSRARAADPLLDLGPTGSAEAEIPQDEHDHDHDTDDVEDVAHETLLSDLSTLCAGAPRAAIGPWSSRPPGGTCDTG